MSRRSSREVNTVPSYTEVDEVPKSEAVEKVKKRSPNKKAREAVNEEQVEIAAESVKSEPFQIKQTDKADTVDCTVEAVTVAKVETSPKKRRIKTEAERSDGDIKRLISTASGESPKVKAKSKRKIEVDEGVEQEVDIKKVKKKRKTKEEKEAEAMPLAARTSIQTLKKAMYIGAHVSGAGGKHFHLTYQHLT
jgi:AP endonuclease 1